ncbi:alpha-D-ribose 1-methylphosphonate 5-triphosphate diphosphatase [Aliiruegeria haliotis]|uniref:Alpha-D-ribose 1-methylphosphonate 5-triphosphate diphosphatase n=1 Tax=Aliiruegeria haliotis TaxID=1280846 RepID=A0A2T0RLL9_9RHOB|nr:alpha-D-ribose 1-methylphosphonate 5-triphosphate diphosphatase [Aliiruegeria haliotis]PRY22089.1 alpha-D-ribose 1-methylphosphonate 5-triphosphate diphosphatase [Aliiruegeria haliotis]
MNSPFAAAPRRNDSPHPEQGELCIANARIVLEDRVMPGAVHVQGDRIVDVSEGDAVPAGAIDAAGDILIPGLVELHTDNLERHIQPRPKVEMPHISAILAHDGEMASCGITTVFDALRLGSVVKADSNYRKYARAVASELLELNAAGVFRVRHMIHLRAEICSDTLVDELAEFGPEDRVGLVSMMDHTPGQRQFRDLAKLRVYLEGKYGMGRSEFDTHVKEQVERRERFGADHEAATVSEARRLGATLASHDDTTRDQVRYSRDMGIDLAEFPTTLEAAQACRDAGIRIIMGAPNLVRGQSHSGNVSARDLAEADLLDIVSSDYAPSLLIAATWHLSRLWSNLPKAVHTVTSTPASAAKLPDRGRIEVGCVADLVRVHPLGDTPVVRTVWRGGVQVG